ncbi:hypothetical protein U1Q18_041500, partial [Sarracenia purpurea var. burkii]
MWSHRPSSLEAEKNIRRIKAEDKKKTQRARARASTEKTKGQGRMVQEEIRRGPWTEQEDVQLAFYVNLFGDRRWDFIAKVTGLK